MRRRIRHSLWLAGALGWSLTSVVSTPNGKPAATVAWMPAAKEAFAAAMVSGHPWRYEFAVENRKGSTLWRFRTSEPSASNASGKVSLRFEVTRRDFSSPAEARKAFDNLFARAHPDTGLSYGWDLVLLGGARLWHLEAPCLYSRANFDRLAANLANAALETGPADRTMRCVCGGGCAVGDAARP